MHQLKFFVETRAFGVCAALGERLGLATRSVRLSFIYLSFLTAGSPILLYLILAFWREMRHSLRKERVSVWEG